MKTNYVSMNIRMWANKPDPTMEAVILNLGWKWFAAKKAYEYARKIKNGRWREAEKIIKQCPYHSYLYAKHVIKGRWREAEEFIANSNSAYAYARYVMKDRFELAETKKNSFGCKEIYLYSRHMLKSRWKKMEGKLLKDAGRSSYDTGHLVNYCKSVIKGRWTKAEPIIAKSCYIKDYAALLKGEELEEFENRVLMESLIDNQPSWQTNWAKRYIESKKPISVAQ